MTEESAGPLDEVTSPAVEREATLRGLEELVDLLRREPGLDLPSFTFTIWEISREDFRETARLMGKTTKQMDGSYISLRRDFSGGVRLEVTIGKESICERVVVGSRWVPPADGYTREEYEWVCRDSIFAVQPDEL
jgi:hypothetical protein